MKKNIIKKINLVWEDPNQQYIDDKEEYRLEGINFIKENLSTQIKNDLVGLKVRFGKQYPMGQVTLVLTIEAKTEASADAVILFLSTYEDGVFILDEN